MNDLTKPRPEAAGGERVSIRVNESAYLPYVLSGWRWPSEHRKESAISVLRALKHIKERFEENLPVGEISTEDQAALDDLDTMIGSFRRIGARP